LPPEHFIQSERTNASDIWSTGCVLYELISGEKPFSTSQDIELSVLYDVLPHLPESCPRALRLLIWQMLEKDPEGRPTAEEILNRDLIKMA